ncbi:MAG TPA: RNA polymerase sigma factor [Saprospiraceae bacterium]|nr:RNA polymerase sigma factor [Saprospiraceae bacterium]HMV25029.1 RNA polymerase sigma factor [Saprospiraceae bacterium]HMX85773.1 RNA polymerase sigma factor [Saprospiraceae bacterium]HMZ73507.1 RNA polymerase sigma factor [Saprospiraceae bacterium]HNA42552.1 RNA polymerase sigma factor [Saprospiraceae bacterium]
MTVQEYNISVDEYADAIYRFAYKMTKSKSDADDLVQVSFEKLWRNYESVEFVKVKSWLFTTIYRSFIDSKRKIKLELVADIEDGGHYEGNTSFELKEMLNKALDLLPEIQKSCILLRDYEGYSYDEIGEILKLSEPQVKVYIFRARTKMKQILTEKFNLI